jgi:penicillin-binding protein 2
VGVTTMNTEDHRGTAYNAFHAVDRGIDFDLAAFPVAGKTGTAEVKDAQGKSKADTALFAAFGPARGPTEVKYAVSVVLEQSGFGGANAAPVAATIFDALAKDGVPKALTVPQYFKCEQLARAAEEEAAQEAESRGTTTTTSTTTPGATTTTAPPLVVDGKPCS